MQSVHWSGFGISNALTRTALHFFPSAGNVSAPYPVTCKLTVYAQGLEPISISVDGLRLSQPEGVWMDEAFPAIKAQNLANFAVEVAMSCSQQRVDLSTSSCIFELCSPGQSIRFIPHLVSVAPEGTAAPRVGMAIKDGFCNSSLLLTNVGAVSTVPEVAVGSAGSGEVRLLNVSPAGGLAPHSITEVDLDQVFSPGFSGEVTPTECSWGLLRTRSLEIRNAAGIFAYMLYRDNLTKRPISITAL